MFMISTVLNDKVEIIQRRIISDQRGWLLKAVTGKENGLPNHTGEIYTVCGYPNQIRGGHYHNLATEWFTLIVGESILRLKDMETKEEYSLRLVMDNPLTIVVPPMIAHQFESCSDGEFMVLAYSDFHYDPSDTVRFNF